MSNSFKYGVNDSFGTKNIEEILQCFICLGRVNNPQLLPCCSKIACRDCIEPWLLTQSRCPHCRSNLRKTQLVPCRFAKDVADIVDNMKSSDSVVGANSDKSNSDMCDIHEAPLYYYCRACSVAICSDCAMFGDTHKGHDFDHLRDIYKKAADQVREHRTHLSRRQIELQETARSVEDNIERVERSRLDVAETMKSVAEECLGRLDILAQKSVQPLFDHASKIQEEVRLLQSMTAEVDAQLTDTHHASFIEQSKVLIPALEDIYLNPMSELNFTVNCPEFENFLAPKKSMGSLTITNFTELQTSNLPLYSDCISTVPGMSWRLKVYPNGNGADRSMFLSVFVEMVKDSSVCQIDGHPVSKKYSYRVELINQRNERDTLVREYSSDFIPGESWGYNRLLLLSTLVAEGFLGDDDSLHLKFGVSAPTYYDQNGDLMGYMGRLEGKLVEMEKKMGELLAANNAIRGSRSIDNTDSSPTENTTSLDILNEVNDTQQHYIHEEVEQESNSELRRRGEERRGVDEDDNDPDSQLWKMLASSGKISTLLDVLSPSSNTRRKTKKAKFRRRRSGKLIRRLLVPNDFDCDSEWETDTDSEFSQDSVPPVCNTLNTDINHIKIENEGEGKDINSEFQLLDLTQLSEERL